MALLGIIKGIGMVNDEIEDIGHVSYEIRIESTPGYLDRRAAGSIKGESDCIHRLANAPKGWLLILDTGQHVGISPRGIPLGQDQDEINIYVNTPIAGY